jgi:hypothetical protein
MSIFEHSSCPIDASLNVEKLLGSAVGAYTRYHCMVTGAWMDIPQATFGHDMPPTVRAFPHGD